MRDRRRAKCGLAQSRAQYRAEKLSRLVNMRDDPSPPWIQWVRALQAISQTGQHYAANPYDAERYRQIGAIAADMLARHSTLPVDEILALQAREFGYATPKVDVRGVAFRDD